jgi:hypothetical protein
MQFYLYARRLARCFSLFVARLVVCAAFFLFFTLASAQTVTQTGLQDWVEVQVSPPPDGVPDYWLEAYFLPSNPRYGWIVGFYRRTLYTTDSGRTWTRSQIPGRLSYNRNDFRNHLEGVSFPDSLVGYASGPGGVFKSVDGGRTWGDITPLSLRGVEARTWGCYFTHRDTGYVMSGGCGDQQLFLRTTNGGNTWTVFSGPGTDAGLSDAIVFSSRGLGYAVASGRIFRTLNGGLSWDIFADSFPPNSPVRNAWQEDIAISGNTFLVPYSGTECSGGGAGGGMRTSTDGGRTWTQFPTGAQMFGVFLVNDSVGWAAGVNGSAYFTEDYGRTWRLRNCGIPPGKDLDDLWFVNDTLGFIVGEGVYRYVPPSERELKIRSFPPSPFYCEGDSLELRVSGGFSQYRWSNGATTASIVVRQSGTYIVTASVFDCVRLSDTIRVTFLRRPSAQISLSTLPRVCAGTTVQLTSALQMPDFTYEWTDGRSVLSRSPTLDVAQSGVYTLFVRNGGCVASSSTTITVFPRPNTDIVSLRQTRFCVGDSALLQAPAGFIRYRWSDGVQMDIGAARELVTRSSGAYSVELTDANGCVWTSNTINLTALDFPKQLFVLSESMEFQMDTTGLNRLTCATITLQNTDAVRTVAMTAIPMARNIEFSVPPSQLPFILPPGSTRSLTVCFSPRDLGVRRDTLYVEDSCGVTAIPLVGEAISNNFAGDSRCRARIVLRTFGAQGGGGGLPTAEVLRLAEPSPNPASARLTLPLERYIEPLADEPVWARCTLKDVLGVTVAEGIYAPEIRFSEGSERYERGEFSLSVGHIPSGAYLLVVQSPHGAATFSVVINR